GPLGSMTGPSVHDRALGAFLGLAVGDALGATVEFMTKGEIAQQYGIHRKMTGGGWLRLKPGQITDDTEMSLALGRSLAAKGTLDVADICEEFALWLKSRPVDVGNTCRRGIRRYMHEGTTTAPYSEGDAGNGAAMRCLPAALATLGHPADLEPWVLAQARITHNHPLSDAACLTLGRMVHHLIGGRGMKACREEANRLVHQHRDFHFEPYKGQSSAYIVDTMQTVLHYYFVTDTFKSCLIQTVNQGGDADTTGALAGMLAGATYGVDDIPSGWLSKLDMKVEREIRRQVDALLALAGLD
nr:Chain A, Adp-ribosyl-[dinitrogen Reductase] Glycohydrolase [Rhodospirillum rubrum]2WOC_B Chain B, Adp-ribosyl-[dinitrogen Reductase] Glycohydrolase [Rhodospirillum rubrum]2WOC_C Chain C, Adp-ribosyl-[dinitrogen Reductase] Glycohydrolase [Rhodospirillum rubrum]2WOD_A Chain A, ADP-RIBOSYL-[DINITROGEN REDUCTASE] GLYCOHYDROLASE [Rhodospirillum rubrum]2WOD_B Chain B, ADP-RIBOSYL-[DINITROGEN REDUCTASE] GLYCOHYDROLASE [Rhodospirillum rubrum]